MTDNLQQLVETKEVTPSELAARTREIYQAAICNSAHMEQGNFTSIHPRDLRRMFELYDERFFENQCRQRLGDIPLHFRFSNRMTSSAGKTVLKRMRSRGADSRLEFEITISATLLYHTFHEGDRAVVMSGIECHDRLEALQRTMEHEIIHLVEVLVWEDSNCRAKRYQSIARRLFGHTEYQHQLITPRERAFTKYGIRAGDQVSFRFEGQHFTGCVNRITKRATVLVADDLGQLYSDGKRYRKFYVPVQLLTPVDNKSARP